MALVQTQEGLPFSSPLCRTPNIHAVEESVHCPCPDENLRFLCFLQIVILKSSRYAGAQNLVRKGDLQFYFSAVHTCAARLTFILE